MSVKPSGPMPGSRPGGAARNGLPGTGRGYRFLGQQDWNPAEGIHHDPGAVLPQAPPPAVTAAGRTRAEQKAAFEDRLARFAVLHAEGVRPDEIKRLLGIEPATQERYRWELRRRARQAEGDER